MKPRESLADKFLHSLEHHHMIAPGETVAVAFSGGADSVALLNLFSEYASRLEVRVAAIHVDHSLRGEESDRDARFAESFANQLEIPFKLIKIDVASRARETGQSLEMAARELRYSALEAAAAELGASKIATAHHKDDLVETMMLRMFKGCGVSALASVPPKRGWIIRPLLAARKSEILEYVRAEGLEFVTDSSNNENAAERNFVRNELLPLVESRFPAAAEKMAGLAEIVREEESVWDEMTARYPCREEDGALCFPKVLFDLPEAAVRRFVRAKIASRLDPSFRPNREIFENILKTRNKTQGSVVIYNDGKIEILSARENVWIERVDKNFMKSASCVKLMSDFSTTFGNRLYYFTRTVYGGEKSGSGHFHFAAKGIESVTLRQWKAGDRIRLEGGMKKLQDYFTDSKFDIREKRASVVIVSEAGIVAVTCPGRICRVSADFYAARDGECFKVSISPLTEEEL